MPELSLTAVVLTHNNQDHVIDCLESLNWCPHILVIDDYSTDYTVDLISQRGIQVLQHRLGQNFSQHRNFALSHVETEWAIFIDSDERVTTKLAKEIQSKLIEDPNAVAYRLHRYDYFLGKHLAHGDTGNWNQVRLGKVKQGKWHSPVHETWEFSGHIGQLDNYLVHYPHPTISNFIEDINFYTTIRAKELFSQGKVSTWWHIILYPCAKFIRSYFFEKGYLDGVHGFVHAMLMTFHSFLVRSKLYVLNQAAKRPKRSG